MIEHIRQETTLAAGDEHGSHTFRTLTRSETCRTTLLAFLVGELIGEQA